MGRSEQWHISTPGSDPEGEPLLSSAKSGQPPSSQEEDEGKQLKARCGVPDWVSAAIILANIVIGIGLINFPAAYRDAGGIPAAFTAQTICLILLIGGLFLMAFAQDACGGENYQDIVGVYCGRSGLLICDVFIIIHDLGTCITLLVILGDQIDQAILFWHGSDFCSLWFLRRSFTLTITSLLLILPWCFSKKLGDYRITSIFGVLTTIYLIWLTMKVFYTKPRDDIGVRNTPKEWIDVFKVVPTICYSFEGHIEAVPLYAGFRGNSKTMKNFVKFVSLCMTICILTYTLFGVYGYLTFGEHVTSDVLASYRPLDTWIIVAGIVVSLKAVTTFPPIFFCARVVCDQMFASHGCVEPTWTEPRRRFPITLCLFLFCLLTALMVPNIGSTIALLGGSAALFIFVFPGLCFMQCNLLSDDPGSRRNAYIGAGMVVIGAFLGGTTIVQSIYSYIDGDFSKAEVACTPTGGT